MGHRRHWLAASNPARACALGVALACATGCYNGEKLVQQAHSSAIKGRLEELDLGQFRITMPLDIATGETTAVIIHPFALTPHYRLKAISKQLKTDRAALEHHTLLAVRSATGAELAEPSLDALRERLRGAANEVLRDEPIQSIGFYDVRFVRQ